MDSYTINLEDIRNYLASVPEGESVGIPQHRHECLIANTLKWKYPGTSVAMWFDNTMVRINSRIMVNPPASVELVADKFDSLWPDDVDLNDPTTYGTIVTVKTLQELIPEIWDESLDIVPIGDPINA